ncbi:MAG TPA: tail protein X [Rhodanobacter sp.]|nr:tail protein X [Rhodanobacter sp.]
MIVRANQGETLDALCQRALGRTEGVTEAALAANPGLADLGVVLPIGTAVHLPDTVQATQSQTALVQLWN